MDCWEKKSLTRKTNLKIKEDFFFLNETSHNHEPKKLIKKKQTKLSKKSFPKIFFILTITLMAFISSYMFLSDKKRNSNWKLLKKRNEKNHQRDELKLFDEKEIKNFEEK